MSGSKLLVVREKEKHAGINGWKLPGGLVNLNEEISAAAVREVFEETGVRSEFAEMLAFRHQLTHQFGRGDVYMICRLEAVTTDIKVDDEIEDAQWMDINEFAAGNKYAMLVPVARYLSGGVSKEGGGLREVTMQSTIPGRPPYKFYMPTSFADVP